MTVDKTSKRIKPFVNNSTRTSSESCHRGFSACGNNWKSAKNLNNSAKYKGSNRASCEENVAMKPHNRKRKFSNINESAEQTAGDANRSSIDQPSSEQVDTAMKTNSESVAVSNINKTDSKNNIIDKNIDRADDNNNNNKKNRKKKMGKQSSSSKRKKFDAGVGDGGGGLQYMENDVMTRYEGYWVLRSCVDQLRRQHQELEASGDWQPQQLRRAVKKLKRQQHRLLVRHLVTEMAVSGGNSDATNSQRSGELAGGPAAISTDAVGDGCKEESTDECKDNTVKKDQKQSVLQLTDQLMAEVAAENRLSAEQGSGSSGSSGSGKRGGQQKMVRFDGVLMPADAVARLKQLRAKLRVHHLSVQKRHDVLKMARRREETRHKRNSTRVCLGCRGHGHELSDCPRAASSSPTTPICFRCGSTEHRLFECEAVVDTERGHLPFAKCFVCGEKGHLSRDCAQNPRGAFPRGGACRVCGLRSHLADECPEKNKRLKKAAEEPPVEDESSGVTVRLQMMAGGSVDADYEHDFSSAESKIDTKIRQPKEVRF